VFSSVGRATSYFSYTSQVIAHFVSNFFAMATGVGRGKMRLAAFDGPSPKTPLEGQKSRKNLLRKPIYSPFCPKFRCHDNQEKGKGAGKENGERQIEGVGQGKEGKGKGEGEEEKKEEGEGEGEGEGKGKGKGEGKGRGKKDKGKGERKGEGNGEGEGEGKG